MKEFREMEREQGGVCAICGEKETRTRRGNLVRLSVDHDHTTGSIRGLLCTRCNTAVGLMQDEPELLRKAIEYLERNKSCT